MALFTATDPNTGRSRQFIIAGDTPTPEEQQQITSFFGGGVEAPAPAASTDMSYADLVEAQRQSILASMQTAEPEPEPRSTAFGVGVGRDPLQRALANATSGRVLAEGSGNETLAEFFRQREEEALAELQEYNRLNPGTGLFDIEGIGSAGRFAGEVLGEEARDFAIQASATAGGAAIGSLFGGVGAAPGAAIGRAVGVGYTTVEMLPQLFAEAINAQEQAGDDPNIAKAALTTLGNAIIEFGADYLTLGAGNAATALRRGLEQGGEAALLQGATEATQEFVTRAQAGLPLTDEEALRSYAEAIAAGSLVGGVAGGVAGAAQPRSSSVELAQDQKEEAEAAEKDAQRLTEAIRREAEEAAAADVEQDPLQAETSELDAKSEKEQRDLEESATALILRNRELDQEISSINDELQRISDEEGADAAAEAARTRLGPRQKQITDESRANREQIASMGAQIEALRNEREARQKQTAPTAPTGEAYNPVENRSFNQAQIDAAINRVRKTGKPATFQDVRKAVSDVSEGTVPSKVVNDIFDEMVARGIVRRVKEGNRKVYKPETDQVNIPAAQMQRQLDDIGRQVEEAERRRDRLAIEQKRIVDTGRNINNQSADALEASKSLNAAQREIEKLKAAQDQVRQRMRETDPLSGIPYSEDPKQTLETINRSLGNAQKSLATARKALASAGQQATTELRNNVARLENTVSSLQAARSRIQDRIKTPSTETQVNVPERAAKNARYIAGLDSGKFVPFTPAYSDRFSETLNNMRSRLDKLGLKDVRVRVENTIDNEVDVEGTYANQIIRLASAIHDPDLSDQEINDRIAAVMNHEVIHALKGMGLFTDAEWQSLTRAAANMRYTMIKKGKPVTRSYTYLQRAESMYASDSSEIQLEEAVAEMFRDYTTGKLRVSGRPQTIFKRIINFFKAIIGANTDSGFKSPAEIFAQIESGEIGTRDRPQQRALDLTAAQTEAETRESRVPQSPLKLKKVKSSQWAGVGFGTDAATWVVDGLEDITVFKKSGFGGWQASRDGKFLASGDTKADLLEILEYKLRSRGELDTRQSRRAKTQDLFESMGVGGALAEYPGVGIAVDRYINQSDTPQKLRANFNAAINDPDYPAYKRDLQANLQRIYGDSDVPVTRTEGYADPRMQKIRKNYNIPQDNIFLVGNPDESELIVRLPDGTIRSARADVSQPRRIRYSNPGGEWLENKQRNAEEDMVAGAGGPGRSSKGLSGATTAWIADEKGYIAPVSLPLSEVKKLPGANDEKPRPGQAKYDELLASVQERGFTDEVPILIGVNHLGQAYITEGNNRVAIADRLGVPTIQAEVRWQNGAEEVDSNWSPSSIRNMVASMPGADEQLFSRRVTMPKESPTFGASGVGLFDNPLAIEGKPNLRNVGEAMTEYHDRLYGRQLFPEDNDADYDLVLDIAAEELNEQLKQPNSGVGWYSKDTQLAIDLTSNVFPSVATPEGRSLYLTLAAIFSSGNTPEQAWMISSLAYDAWDKTGVIPVTRAEAARAAGREVEMSSYIDKRTGERVTKPAGWTKRNPDNERNIKILKLLAEREGSIEAAVNWLTSIQPRTAINQVMLDSGMKTPRYKTKQQQAGPDEFGAQVFGEKLGPYSLGLHGVEITGDQATVDLWFVRSYRRWTGRLLEGPIDPDTKIVGQPSSARDGIERRTIFRMTNDLSQRFSGMPPGDAQAVLWFFEKRLWGAQGINTYEGTNSSGARRLLASRGIGIDDGTGGAASREPLGKEPARTTNERERRFARRARAEQGGDPAGTGRYDTDPQIAPREVRTPEQRPAAEAAASDLEPVTSADLRNLNEEFFLRPGWAIVTATQENLDPQFKDSMNKRANDRLEMQLQYENIPYLKIEGTYKGEDQGVSFLIIAPRSTAELLGKQNEQESILTNEGLYYTKRPLPDTPATGVTRFGEEARTQEFYSETPDGFAFSMDLNFDMGPGKSVFPADSYERTDRPQLPIRRSDNLVELFHWSDQMLTEVDPAFAGTGPLIGAERRRGARLGFFGINPRDSQRQPGTGYYKEGKLGNFKHRALVNPDDLYPWVKDPLKLRENLTSVEPDAQTSEIEQRIRDAGYRGYYMEDDGNVRYPSAPLGNVAAMFEPVPVTVVSDGERLSRRARRSVAADLKAKMNAYSGTSDATLIHKKSREYTGVANWLGRQLGVITRDQEAAQEAVDKFYQAVLDSKLPIARVMEKLNERGFNLLDAMDPVMELQLKQGRAGAQIGERERKGGLYSNMVQSTMRLRVNDSDVQGLKDVTKQARAKVGSGIASYYFDRYKSRSQAVGEMYLYALHAVEKNRYITQIDPNNPSGSGMPNDEAVAILNWIDQNMTPEQKSALALIRQSARDLVADTNKNRVEGGLIPSEFVAVEMESDYTRPEGERPRGKQPPNFQDYVPTRGDIDDDATDGPAARNRKSPNLRSREDPRLKGRYVNEKDSYGVNLISELIYQNQRSIIRADENQARLAYVDLVEKSNAKGIDAAGTIILNEYERNVPIARVFDSKGMIQWRERHNYRQDDDVIIAKRNGRDIVVRAPDANIAGVFNGKNIWKPDQTNAIFRGMYEGARSVNKWLSAASTSFNPDFVLPNIFRDLGTAGVNINEFEQKGLATRIAKNTPKAIYGIGKAEFSNDFSNEYAQMYREFLIDGGASASNPMESLRDQVMNVDGMMRDLNDTETAAGKAGKSAIRGLKKLGNLIETANFAAENGVRLSTYIELRKILGDSPEARSRAAQAARSVTVDFTQTGDIGNLLNGYYLFFKASANGTIFMFRAAARSKKVKQALAGLIAAGVAMDLLNALLSGEDEEGINEYDDIPEYVLEHNLILMIPEPLRSETGRPYISIPLAYGLNFFYNAGRAPTSFFRSVYTGSNHVNLEETTQSIGRTLLEVANPLGGSEHFLNLALPTIADPFVELYGHGTDFTGRDIRPDPFPGQNVANSSLYWATTSPSAIATAQFLNEFTGGNEIRGGWVDISPETLEYWFDFVTGGAGGFVQRTVELPAVIADPERSAESKIRSIPLVRKFIGSVSEREDADAYFRFRDQVKLVEDEIDAARDARDAEEIRRLRRVYAREIRAINFINNVERRRRQISDRINQIRDNDRLPEERKNELISRLMEQRDALMQRALRFQRERD